MAEPKRAESPLETAAGAAGPETTEAFALLANETRLAILLALWEAYDPRADDNTVSFSKLQDRVGYDSPGNFSYHLEQLEGHFVRKPAGGAGYELRTTGLKLVWSVVAGAGVDDTTVDPVELDVDCPLCGAPTAVTYRDGVVYSVCTECAGRHPDRHDPEGVLSAMKFDPAGVTDRTAEELIAASTVASGRHIRTMSQGLCGECSGPVDATLEICTDHEPEGVCSECGREFVCWVHFQCRICKDFHGTVPAAIAISYPAVIAFYYDHGISTRVDADDFESAMRHMEAINDHETAVVSEDPPLVDVTFARNGDEITLTFDETATVVKTTR